MVRLFSCVPMVSYVFRLVLSSKKKKCWVSDDDFEQLFDFIYKGQEIVSRGSREVVFLLERSGAEVASESEAEAEEYILEAPEVADRRSSCDEESFFCRPCASGVRRYSSWVVGRPD